MLYPKEKDPSEHFRRAGRGAGICLNQIRLGVFALLRSASGWTRATVVKMAKSFLSALRKLHLPSARQMAIALACCTLLSLVALSSITLVNQFGITLARQAVVVLISVVTVFTILLCYFSIGVAVGLVRNRRAREKRSTETPSRTGPSLAFTMVLSSLLNALKVGAIWMRKLAAYLTEFCKYVVQSTPSALFFYGPKANASSVSKSNEPRYLGQDTKDIRIAGEPEIGKDKLVDVERNQADSNGRRGNSTNASVFGGFKTTRELHETDPAQAEAFVASREIWMRWLSAVATLIAKKHGDDRERATKHRVPEVTKPSESTKNKSFSALSISIFSKSINSVSVAAIDLFSFTRNSFSLLNVSAFATSVIAFALLTISLISITFVEVQNGPETNAGVVENGVCENCILWERFSENYLARLSAFVAPRRNFDVGEGSYVSWPLGNSTVEMSIPKTQALCGSAVVIAAGMSSRSGSLELNIRIADARSHEAAREVNEAISECSLDGSHPRIVRVVLAERYVHAKDTSERLSLYLTSKVGDVSRGRIMAAIDNALNEDEGLTVNPEKSFAFVACPVSDSAGQGNTWLASDALLAIGDEWARECLSKRIAKFMSIRSLPEDESSLALAAHQDPSNRPVP